MEEGHYHDLHVPYWYKKLIDKEMNFLEFHVKLSECYKMVTMS